MRIRLALTLDISRQQRQQRQPEGEEQFEHRDTDSVIEATNGGDHSLHRMGFTPTDPDEE